MKILPDKVYEVLKWVLGVVAPALNIAIVGFGEVYGWDVVAIVKTIAIVTSFFGTIFGISMAAYANYRDKED